MSMMDQDTYTLRWNTYSDHLQVMMQQMRLDTFTDVTLVSDDKKTIKAHRSILSACSGVFKNIFMMDNQQNHPVIYLRGVQCSDIESILRFIYFGEVDLEKERMNEFLSVSKDLEIKELCGNVFSESKIQDEDPLIPKEAQNITAKEKEVQNDMDPPQPLHRKEEINGVVGHTRKELNDFLLKCDFSKAGTGMNEAPLILNNIRHTNTKSNKMGKPQRSNENQLRRMESEVKENTNDSNLQSSNIVHNVYNKITIDHSQPNKCVGPAVKTRQRNVTLKCQQCDQMFQTQMDLVKHMHENHFKDEGVKFECENCNFIQFSSHGQLVRHNLSVHQGAKKSKKRISLENWQNNILHPTINISPVYPTFNSALTTVVHHDVSLQNN